MYKEQMKTNVSGIEGLSENVPDKEMNFNFIKLYLDEWKFRFENYYSWFFKLSIVVYGLILLPYIYGSLRIDIAKFNVGVVIFPILGAILSIIELLLLLSQNARLLILTRKMKFLTENIGLKYSKDGYEILSNFKDAENKFFRNFKQCKVNFYKKRLGSVICIINFTIQIIISVGVIVMLLLKSKG